MAMMLLAPCMKPTVQPITIHLSPLASGRIGEPEGPRNGKFGKF